MCYVGAMLVTRAKRIGPGYFFDFSWSNSVCHWEGDGCMTLSISCFSLSDALMAVPACLCDVKWICHALDAEETC